MTFASEIKTEISKCHISSKCCAIAEIYAILQVCTTFSHTYIKITTENKEISKRIPILFKKAFNINVSSVINNKKNIFEIDNPLHLQTIFNEFGFEHKYHINYHLNRSLVDNECCVNAFLRGLFLMTGVVSAPDKKSHLEISTTRGVLFNEILSLMQDNYLKPKQSKRQNKFIIYFKDTSLIEEFLSKIGAKGSLFKLLEAKVQKEIINSVNRRVNCETANLTKTIEAGALQASIISSAIDKNGIDIFPQNLHFTINLRLNNPDISLSELASIFDPPISKSAINHRLRKILQIAKRSI